MHRAAAALLALLVSLLGGLPLGFLLSPDPTGTTPLLVALLVALFATPFLYRELRDE